MSVPQQTNPHPADRSAEFKQALKLLGPPPIVEGEDQKRYDQLFSAVVEAVQPKDILQWILVRDVVDHQWEILRLRLAKANLISVGRASAAHAKLYDEPQAAAKDSVDAEIARGVAMVLNQIRAIDGMLLTMEVRRNNAVREAERRRAAFDTDQSRAARQVEDAEFRVIEDKAA